MEKNINSENKSNMNLEENDLSKDKYSSDAPKVSVVMAVYNTKEEYLRDAIESILNQSYKNFEFIIVNDGSTTNVEEVVKSYSDERIRYFYQNNQGSGGARNNGIKQAKGEYIAIMDSDDISLPERIEKEIIYLEKNKDVFIVGSYAEVFPQKRLIRVVENPKILDLFVECSFVHSTVMFKRNEFLQKGFSYKKEWSLAEDYYLWYQILKSERAHNIQEVLVKYRIEGQGITASKRELAEMNTIKAQQEILNYLTDDKKLQNNIVKAVYKDVKVTKKSFENLFSIKNLNIFNKKYKVITLLGIEIRFLAKEYKID